MGCFCSKKAQPQGYEDPIVLAAETPCEYASCPWYTLATCCLHLLNFSNEPFL